MEIWNLSPPSTHWVRAPDVAQGLACVLDAPEGDVLVLVTSPQEALRETRAAARLIRRLSGGRGRLLLATAHPTRAWAEQLGHEGVDEFWAVEHPPPAAATGPAPLGPVGESTCANLHTRTADGFTLSVCGRHADLMVIAGHHMSRWCLHRQRPCPHRPDRGSDD